MNYKFFINKGHLHIFKKSTYEMIYNFIINNSNNYKMHSYDKVIIISIVNNVIGINNNENLRSKPETVPI